MAIHSIQRAGADLLVLMDDDSVVECFYAGADLWLVGENAPAPEPGTGFKFPFPRSELRFDSYFGHSGIDWSGGVVGNTAAIHAIGAGTVQAVYTNPVNDPNDFGEPQWRGNCVVINHGVIGGITIWSLYAHMRDAPTVTVGQSITAGQIIGRVGNTGASDGAHLHLEVIYNGTRLPTSTPGNNVPGLGFTRTLDWLDANASGSWG